MVDAQRLFRRPLELLAELDAAGLPDDLPGLEELTKSIAGEHGFAEIEHEVEFFGTCLVCKAER